jgi:hypothetical protein
MTKPEYKLSYIRMVDYSDLGIYQLTYNGHYILFMAHDDEDANAFAKEYLERAVE